MKEQKNKYKQTTKNKARKTKRGKYINIFLNHLHKDSFTTYPLIPAAVRIISGNSLATSTPSTWWPKQPSISTSSMSASTTRAPPSSHSSSTRWWSSRPWVAARTWCCFSVLRLYDQQISISSLYEINILVFLYYFVKLIYWLQISLIKYSLFYVYKLKRLIKIKRSHWPIYFYWIHAMHRAASRTKPLCLKTRFANIWTISCASRTLRTVPWIRWE